MTFLYPSDCCNHKKIWHQAEDFRTLEQRDILSAYFTFVAIDDDAKPTSIPPVIPETPDQKRRFEDAEHRRQRRLTAHHS